MAEVNEHNSCIIQQQQYHQELEKLRMHQMKHEVRQAETVAGSTEADKTAESRPNRSVSNALKQGVDNVPSETQPSHRHSKRGRKITCVQWKEDDSDDDEDAYEEEYDGAIVDGFDNGQEGGREGGGYVKVGRTKAITTTTSDSVISVDQQ